NDLQLHPVGGERLARHLRRRHCLLDSAAPSRVGQHAYAQRADQLEEPLAHAAARLLATQRDGDNPGARRLHRARQHLRRWVLRRADKHARRQLNAIQRKHAFCSGRWFGRVHGSAQPPCRGDTISMRSPALSVVAARARSGTKSPLRAVAMRAPESPRSTTRSANVAASVANGSPLTRMARLTPASLTFTAPNLAPS